jgi:hypothetical protein
VRVGACGSGTVIGSALEREDPSSLSIGAGLALGRSLRGAAVAPAKPATAPCARRRRKLHRLGHRVFLRVYHEFNGTWMVYSGCGSEFISAWQRTVSLVRGEGATNGVWVWNPAERYQSCAFESYPGDGWVDWVAVDGYNRNDPTGWCSLYPGWCEFWEIFRHTPSLSLHDVYGPRKPFAVFETGTVEDPKTPGRKGQWHRDALASIT